MNAHCFLQIAFENNQMRHSTGHEALGVVVEVVKAVVQHVCVYVTNTRVKKEVP